MENNVAFDIQGYREIEKKLPDPSFTLTLKIWKYYTRAIGVESKQGNGGGTFSHIDLAIDFYTWVFPKRRHQLIKMISGKAAFLESIKEELEDDKWAISSAVATDVYENKDEE